MKTLNLFSTRFFDFRKINCTWPCLFSADEINNDPVISKFVDPAQVGVGDWRKDFRFDSASDSGRSLYDKTYGDCDGASDDVFMPPQAFAWVASKLNPSIINHEVTLRSVEEHDDSFLSPSPDIARIRFSLNDGAVIHVFVVSCAEDMNPYLKTVDKISRSFMQDLEKTIKSKYAQLDKKFLKQVDKAACRGNVPNFKQELDRPH